MTVPPEPPVIVTTTRSLSMPTTYPHSSLLYEAPSAWIAAAGPSQQDIQLLRTAMGEFYGLNRDLVKAQQLLTQVLAKWQNQPDDEVAGLYRVRGDADTLLGQADSAIADYSAAIRLLEGNEDADPTELPTALLGRARARKSQVSTPEQAQQAANDYKRALILLSNPDDWDTDEERLADGVRRNPYAAWEYGSVLRQAGQVESAATAHEMASLAFVEIGDKARSVLSRIDFGIDLAASPEKQLQSKAKNVLQQAVDQKVEGRDVALLQRVIAKEGEGRMALAALLWNQGQRDAAERVLGQACERLDQVVATSGDKKPQDDDSAPLRLLYSIDDDSTTDLSCSKFKNPTFLTERLGWPESLQKKVIKLETLQL